MGFQVRDDFVANQIAFDGGVVIRGIFTPRLVILLEVGFEFGVAAAEERAHEADRADLGTWADAREGVGA